MSTEAVFSIFMTTAVKSLVVLAIAWLVTAVMRGRSAAARHLVWIAAAAALLALPILSILVPQLEMPGTAAIAAAPIFSVTVTATPTTRPADAPSVVSQAQASTKPIGGPSMNWRLWILMLWAVGAFVGFARMIAGTVAVWRVRRDAPPFGDRAMSAELARSLGIEERVEILESRAGSMPMTFGLMRPAVFLPKDAAEWTEERRRVVLLHELAHVKRSDIGAHLFARIAFTLYWWNPLVWTAWREFLKERERATDDLVLNAGTRASDYAGHLLEVARTMASTPAVGWAAIAIARRSQLEGRLVAILDEDVNRGNAGRRSAWITAAVAIALVAPLAALRAQDPQSQTIPPDVDAFIRSANSQKNHKMLEDAAKAALQLQKFDTAEALLKSAAEIRADVSGGQSTDYAMALMKVGDVEDRRHNDTSATEFYAKAANILGLKPEAAPALTYLGTQALIRKDFPAALDYFQRVRAADPAHAGNAVMWMAIIQWRSGLNGDQVDGLFKSAIALQDPKSIDAANTMQIYAKYLRTHAEPGEAADLEMKAESIRKLALASPAMNAGPGFAAESAYDQASGKYARTEGTPLLSGVYKIGGAVSQPQLLRKVEPGYSELARVAGFSGSVGLSIVVGVDGTPQNVRVTKSLGFGLDEKAMEAVSRWRFTPGKKDGEPVPVIANIDVNFRLL